MFVVFVILTSLNSSNAIVLMVIAVALHLLMLGILLDHSFFILFVIDQKLVTSHGTIVMEVLLMPFSYRMLAFVLHYFSMNQLSVE
tara:strand:+ start:506 stop:763 length:258 start_codon:yes stop_codon:yes gene_type:complete